MLYREARVAHVVAALLAFLATGTSTAGTAGAQQQGGGIYPTLPPLPHAVPARSEGSGICVFLERNPNVTALANGTTTSATQAIRTANISAIPLNESTTAQAKTNKTAAGAAGLIEVRRCCEGYAKNRYGRCDPLCPAGCPVGSNCTAPGLCSCLGDKVHDLAGNCVDTCPHSCLNGVCVGSTCKCSEGFREAAAGGRGAALCAPHCEGGCLGGNCTAPGVCTCNKGFVKDSLGRCVASCRGGCLNADCTAPDQCTCHAGHTRSRTQANVCESQCPDGCVNAQCTAPSTCTCLPGHEPDPKDERRRRCVPRCSQGCVNGDCTAPETCTCRPGFALATGGGVAGPAGVCVANCDPACVNGDCLQAGRCSCHQGYVKDPQDSTGSQCIPFCPGGCGRGGRCVAPGQCSCEAGFVNETPGKGCQPVCAEVCVNADCTAPNQCTCRQGYRKDIAVLAGNKCIPVCPEGCINGECVSPGVCSCKAGFRKDANDPRGRTCVSDCLDGCPNGICRGPDNCVCVQGFTKSPMGRCEAKCAQGCLNGDCTGPDTCTCRVGYEHGTGTPHVCVPKCGGGCENGVCSGPDFCICKAGFKKDKSNKLKCVPLPPRLRRSHLN